MTKIHLGVNCNFAVNRFTEPEVWTEIVEEVGIRYVNSQNCEDRNPYQWIGKLGAKAGVIHLQQTNKKASQHWPFTDEYNRKGVIRGEDVVQAIEESGVKEIFCVFEINHKAFYPIEEQVIDDIRKSVDYWRKYIKD